MLHAAITGLVTGLSLIVAIGAQNAYVLRQGILRSHVAAVVAVCAVSDLILIFAGVGGIGALVDRAGLLLDVVRWFGVTFLLWYAVGAVRRAIHAEALFAANDAASGDSLGRVAGRAVALTWLNPHVYIDAFLLLGSIAATQDDVVGGRWWFAAGASAASLIWFAGLGFGASLLAPALNRSRVWQVLELAIAATMVVVAAKLAVG